MIGNHNRYDNPGWRDLAMPQVGPDEYTRSRSFVERYVIERAAHFAVGNERKDAYQAALDGYSIYEQMGLMDAAYREKGRDAMQEQQAQAVAGMVGAYGNPPSQGAPPIPQQNPQVFKVAPPNPNPSMLAKVLRRMS